MSADLAAQRQIVERLDETILVEAGAGTGKTRALVDRVVALVMKGTRIERIAAITFTERAAAELRERVRAALDTRIATPGLAPEAMERCICARDDLERAQLSTIHAFGQSVLRSLSAEAGIDPDMSVLDQLTAERRFEERWRAALERVDPDSPDGRALDLALGRGLTIDGLRELAIALGEREDVAAAIIAEPPAAPTPRWGDLADMRGELVGLPLDAVRGDDACLQHIHDLLALIDDASDADPWMRDALLTGSVGFCGRRLGNAGRQDNWGGRAAIQAARNAAMSVGARIVALVEAARTEALAGILPWLARVIAGEAQARRREGTLVFADLILWTRDLLRDSPSARAALRERYDVLLIDEFQDTDPWQVDIADSFACGAAGRLGPGRLFLVGDPKQSIYRFRRADMAVYASERARVEADGGLLLPLTENRRSRGVILDWVNAVVGRLIDEEPDPTLQAPYAPIEAERALDLAGPGVAWMGGPSADRAWEVRMAEADDVAATCRTVVEEGWEVAERTGEVRPARLRDIAVLIPARTGLSALERALRRAGLPFRVEGGSLVFRTQELRDIINCLTAIDDPADEVAVVGALRSAAFACSDVELAEHRREGLRFNYLAPALDGRPDRVAEALRCLRAHHLERHDRSLSSVVERFVAERHLVELGLIDGRSRDAYRRARFVVEQARAFEADRPQGLRAFVAWLEERTSGPVLDLEGAGLDDDEDAVRILTVHAAKGLESPIVILAGIGPNPPYAKPPTVSLDDAGGVVATIGSKSAGRRLTVGDVATLEAREAEHQRAEAARLLYVATTRARDHLVVSLHHQGSRATKGGAARLIAAGAQERAPRWDPPGSAPRSGVTPLADLVVDVSPVPADEHPAARAALVERARRIRYTSATGMAAASDAPQPTERREGGDEPWARGRGGTRVGRAVHASLQTLPLDAGAAEIAAVARAQAVGEAVPERADEVAALVTAALGSDAAGRARSADGALREVPFALARDGAVVEGFIDLVVPHGDGLEIVDWKTDDVTAGQVADRLRGYELQAGLYALGLRAATGLPITRITYVFVRAGVERSPGDPDELAQSAAGAVSASPRL